MTDKATLAGPVAYTCPPTDGLGFALGDNTTNTDPIFCSYPAVAGENPMDFFCDYSATTGALTTDNDAGLCEPTAVSTGSSGATPSGSVTFTLFSNGTCSSLGTAGSPITLSGGVASSASSGPLSAGELLV